MRVSTPYQYNAARQRITDTHAAMFLAQQRVSTGKRIRDLSDDPYGLNQVVSMRSLKSGLDQYAKNIDRASTWLKANENVLSEMNKLVTRANSLAVSGANGTAGLEERAAMANEVAEIRDRIVRLGNTRDASGEYIFSGTATDTQPFVMTPTGLTYQGNAASVQIEAGPGQNTTINIGASQMVTELYARLDSLSNAIRSGSASAVGTQGIEDMQASLRAINGFRGELGIRAKSLEEQKSMHARRAEDLTKGISDVEDVDLTQAIMDLKNAETAYQASLQVASQGFRLSLMDFIRG